MGIEEMFTNPRRQWQNAFAKRLIGSIRRDSLDQVIVLNDRHVTRILTGYFKYYHGWRTHPSPGLATPESRLLRLPAPDRLVQFPEVGGRHLYCERLAV